MVIYKTYVEVADRSGERQQLKRYTDLWATEESAISYFCGVKRNGCCLYAKIEKMESDKYDLFCGVEIVEEYNMFDNR